MFRIQTLDSQEKKVAEQLGQRFSSEESRSTRIRTLARPMWPAKKLSVSLIPDEIQLSPKADESLEICSSLSIVDELNLKFVHLQDSTFSSIFQISK